MYRQNADISMPPSSGQRNLESAGDIIAAVVIGAIMAALAMAYMGIPLV